MLSRIAAKRGVPSTVMYELAATSRHESPQPMTKVQPTKPPYFLNLADGQKKMAPVVSGHDTYDKCMSQIGKKICYYQVSTASDPDGYLSNQSSCLLA
jgi:hypothetical protein